MFVAINRLKVKQGHGHELEERFARRGGVEQQPGFLGFELLKRVWSHHDDGVEEYLVMTHWHSREHHTAWTQSEAFAQAHAGPRPDFLAGPGEPSGYEVCLSRRPAFPTQDEKTMVLLVGHGLFPNDFPEEELRAYWQLHLAEVSGELSQAEEARLAELESRLLGWPRTPENDPHYHNIQSVAQALEAECRLPVRVVFNEFCAPTLEEGVRQAAEDGYRRILVLSTMLNRGGHPDEDIPRTIARAREAVPDVEVEYVWPYEPEDVAGLLASHLMNCSLVQS